MGITLRLKPTDSTLRLKVAPAPSTPELQAAVASAGAAASTSTANAALTAADVVSTHADVVLTHADAASTAADVVSTNADAASTAADAISTHNDSVATAADRVQTGADAASANNSANSAAASAADAAMSADIFDDVWLGTKTSDPTVDNDGNPLATGQLYFNVISNTLKIYNGAAWQSYTAASGLAAVVDDTSPSLGGNLSLNGHNITASGSETIDGRDVSADGTKLDGIEASADVTDAGNVGAAINGASSKSTPADSDKIGILDSAASYVLKYLTWANLKATLKTYFDTLYQPLASALTSWASVTRASGFDTFTATPSSANLASLLTDETGSGAAVFASAPTLSNPVVGTQTAEDASTKAASTAYADRARQYMDSVGYNSGSPKTITQANEGGRVIVLFSGTTYTLSLNESNITQGKFICTVLNFNSGNCTISTAGSHVLNWHPTGGTGTRTLASNGICTIIHSGGSFSIAGQGLT